MSHSESRGPSEAGRTLHIIVEAESDLQMSPDEVDKVETLGREGESSEDIPASEEPELGLSDPRSIVDKKHCVMWKFNNLFI